jgi:hypothetical protein
LQVLIGASEVYGAFGRVDSWPKTQLVLPIVHAVRFRGGSTTTLTLPRPLMPQQLSATHEPVRRQIDALLDEYTDAEVARILNEQQKRTGAGDSFSTKSVQWVRYSAKIKNLKERLLDAKILGPKFIYYLLCKLITQDLANQKYYSMVYV